MDFFSRITTVPYVRKIMFNDPATIVFWDDGTKTVVKVAPGDKYVPYYGFLAALAKKIYGNNTKVQEMIRPWLPEEEKPAEKKQCHCGMNAGCLFFDNLDDLSFKEEMDKKVANIPPTATVKLRVGDTDGDKKKDKITDEDVGEFLDALYDLFMLESLKKELGIK